MDRLHLWILGAGALACAALLCLAASISTGEKSISQLGMGGDTVWSGRGSLDEARMLRMRGRGSRLQGLYQRQPDNGEDMSTAIDAPDKNYEWPWLRDGKFTANRAVDIYNDRDMKDKYWWPQTYKRRAYDEYGADAYEPDMSVAQDCYDYDELADCYRNDFDKRTGYLKKEHNMRKGWRLDREYW